MAETLEKTGKKKVYKVATELNLSHETLIDFLRKKGYEVKGHMSLVSEEMMRDIHTNFKKDKDLAERHQRKIQEIRETKKRTEKKVEERVESVAGIAPPHPLHPPIHEPAQPVQAKEAVRPPVSTKSSTPAVEEVQIAEGRQTEPFVPLPSPPVEVLSPGTTVEEPLPVLEEPVGEPDAGEKSLEVAAPVIGGGVKYLSPLEKERRAPKSGLTIKGKIDLTRKKSEDAKADAEKSGQATAVEEIHKKKKKKKKVREESAVKVLETDDLERKRKKTKKVRQTEINQNEVKDAIRRTFAAMEDVPSTGRAILRRRKRKEREEEELRLQEEALRDAGKLRVTEFVSVNELANLMRVNVADVIKKCMDLGIMVSINQRLEKDTITVVADEFGFEVTFYDEITEDETVHDVEDDPKDLFRRPPVVTIMGHVDHGKTSLLDYIRQSNIVAGEAGGITQHIGAYEVTTQSGNKSTFLDTPGHEAFTAMRARGAQVTDIVVLVVAADDSVMPQTLEAISHAQAAGVPIIIAINKTDKPEANPDRIRQQLAEKNVLVEEWGGKYQSVEISARTGKHVDLLLEKIVLEADVLDLKANPHREAWGTIIEAQIDRGRGTTATVLVQKGTLCVGDPFLAGIYSGKVRSMFDERGNRVETAGPSTPAQITGLDGIPQAGDTFIAMKSDRDAREISLRRQQLKREQDFRQVRLVTLDDISKQIQEGQVKELAVIVKGDVDGSVEALSDSLMKTQHKEVKLNVIHSGVGMISESDVMLAAASNAVIIGFRVRPNLNARRLAEREQVDIRSYNIIYDAISDVHKALEGMLAPEKKEEIVGTVEVREVFKVPKVGLIAGCYVQDGKVMRNNRVRLVRDGIQIYEGTISSLKRFKDDVREVEGGFECGIALEGYNDIKVSDVIEAFKVVETKRRLTE